MQKFKSSVELDLVASPALGEVAEKEKLPEPQELSCAEFAKAASAEKLVNHGRGWKVSYGGKGLGWM